MSDFAHSALTVAIISEVALIAMLAWSILVPDRRLWPPRRVNWLNHLMARLPTLTALEALSSSVSPNGTILAGRFGSDGGAGLASVLAGNAVVWRAALGIGHDATSGAVAELKTDGCYHWSRSPQYVADMGILAGWAILSASPSAWLIAIGGVIVFALAPFAEEPWLEDVYGAQYRTYRECTPRFLGDPR